MNLPLLEDNSFERLESETNIGELIAVFGERLIDEPGDVSRAVACMEATSTNPRAENWAVVSDVIANVVGIGLTPKTTPTTTRESIPILDNMQGVQPLKPQYIPTPIKPNQLNSPVRNIDEARARIEQLYTASVDNLLAGQPYDVSEAA